MKIIKFNHMWAMVVSLLLIAGCGTTGELTLIESSGSAIKAVAVTCDDGPCDQGEISATAKICVTVEPAIDPSTVSLSLTCNGESYEIGTPEVTQGADNTVLCYSDYEQPPQVTTCTVAVNETPSASASVAKADSAPVYTVDVKTKCGSYDDFTNSETLEKCWYAMLCSLGKGGGGVIIANDINVSEGKALNSADPCIKSWDPAYVDELTGLGSGWDEIKEYVDVKFENGVTFTPKAALVQLIGAGSTYFLHVFKSFDKMDINASAAVSWTNFKHGFENGFDKPGAADGAGFGVGDNWAPYNSCAWNGVAVSTALQVLIPNFNFKGLGTIIMEGNIDGAKLNWMTIAERHGWNMNNQDDQTEAMNQAVRFMFGLHSLNDWVGHHWMDIDLSMLDMNARLGTICGIDLDNGGYITQLPARLQGMDGIKMAFPGDLTDEVDLWNAPAFPVGAAALWMEMAGNGLTSSYDVGFGRTDFGKSYAYVIDKANKTTGLVSIPNPVSAWFDETSGQNVGFTFIPAIAAAGQKNFQAQAFSINVGKGPISLDEPVAPADASTYPSITIGNVYICPGGDGAIPKAIDFTNGYSGKYFDRTPARFCQ